MKSWVIRWGQRLARLAREPGPLTLRRQTATRQALAAHYLRGQGIEIGALHNPMRAPAGAQVRYVDRMTTDALRRAYPELKDLPLVPVDIVDDGESLAAMAAASQDFVIANHFLEHCQNPLLALVNMLRVLKSGGILFLTVPDKRHTFDRGRPLTPLDHTVRDYRDGPAWSRRSAYEEYVRYVEHVTDPEAIRRRVDESMARDDSIHYHAWTEIELTEMLLHLRRVEGVPLAVEALIRNDTEVILVLRKTADDATTSGPTVRPAPDALRRCQDECHHLRDTVESYRARALELERHAQDLAHQYRELERHYAATFDVVQHSPVWKAWRHACVIVDRLFPPGSSRRRWLRLPSPPAGAQEDAKKT